MKNSTPIPQVHYSEEDLDTLQTIQQVSFGENMFKDTARDLQISTQEFLGRLRRLKEKGLLRRWGAIIDGRLLGYYSALVAVQLDQQDIEKFTKRIREIPGITHGYIREFLNITNQRTGDGMTDFNCWFTLTDRTYEEFCDVLENLQTTFNLDEKHVLILKSQQRFKLGVHLNP